jgi:hypothetical protein
MEEALPLQPSVSLMLEIRLRAPVFVALGLQMLPTTLIRSPLRVMLNNVQRQRLLRVTYTIPLLVIAVDVIWRP